MPPFEVLYDTHVDFVWRIARRLGVAEAALDDAVQEVFLVAHRRAAEFEGRGTVRAWLYGIVRRVARDHRPSRRERFDARGTPDTVDPRTAHDRLERAEAMRTLYALLDELDDERREVFVLAELEQIPMPEAAQMLGLNVNTAHARLRAARAKMEKGIARLRAARREQP
jgi:RNA polymerase sigma-70 factor (ECF subfamily)